MSTSTERAAAHRARRTVALREEVYSLFHDGPPVNLREVIWCLSPRSLRDLRLALLLEREHRDRPIRTRPSTLAAADAPAD